MDADGMVEVVFGGLVLLEVLDVLAIEDCIEDWNEYSTVAVGEDWTDEDETGSVLAFEEEEKCLNDVNDLLKK